MKGLTPKLYGSFDAGFGEYIPASSEARTLKVQFRSNKKKNAGGFRCQVLLQRRLEKFEQLEQLNNLINMMNNRNRLLRWLPPLDLGPGQPVARAPGDNFQSIITFCQSYLLSNETIPKTDGAFDM